MSTLKYFAQKTEDGYPIPSTMMGFKETPDADLVEIPAGNTAAGPGQTIKKPASGLRYFVRRDANGKIIPNSLMTTVNKPSGLVYEFKVLSGSAPTLPVGDPNAKVTLISMMSPGLCQVANANLFVVLEGGDTIATATGVSGNFASVNSEITPPVTINGMTNMGSTIAVGFLDEATNIWQYRNFFVDAVGHATGIDAMQTPTSLQECVVSYTTNEYTAEGGCLTPLTGQLARMIKVPSGTTVTLGKFYKELEGTSIFEIVQNTSPSPNHTLINATISFDTCDDAAMYH